MPGLDLSPETVDAIRQTEPIACPYCADEHEGSNYNLRIVDQRASSRLVGVVLRCSIGHVFLDAFVAIDGHVYSGTVPVDAPADPETRH